MTKFRINLQINQTYECEDNIMTVFIFEKKLDKKKKDLIKAIVVGWFLVAMILQISSGVISLEN